MNDEEIDRYQRILEDWTPSGKKPPTPPRMTQPEREPVQPAAPPGPTGRAGAPYREGAILCLNQRTVAIYNRPIPEKEYHLMQVLHPGNRVKMQGIAVEGYAVEELGCLPPEHLKRLQSEMRWDRDLIAFHCYSYEDVEKLPQQAAAPAEGGGGTSETRPAQSAPAGAAPAAEASSNGRLHRGQRVTVQFGDKMWEAVYWGKDDQGEVVAHQTNRVWSLMHLDLHRFGSGLEVDPEIDVSLVKEIEQSLGSA